MRTPRFRRTPVLLAGLALATTTLVVTAPPASAAVIEGSVQAHSYVEAGPGCDIAGDAVSDTQPFTNRTGARTAEADGDYIGTATGTATVGATGHSSLETTAYGAVRNRAFKRVDFESTQVVRLKNDSAVDCGMVVLAHSEADAMLRVRERGRIKLKWNSSVGDLALVSLTGPAGTVFSRDPSHASGEVTLRVRPGVYEVATRFTTSVREADVPTTTSVTRIGFFTLAATYLG